MMIETKTKAVGGAGHGIIMYLFVPFVSAMLLFQLELVIAKYILPWFGGTPNVWSVSMLFFQLVLIGGYLYAHALVTRLSPFGQMAVHVAALALSLVVILGQLLIWGQPLLPGSGWKPTGSDLPSLRILIVLVVSVGMPFLMLSTTSSLLQAWFSRRFPGRSPYWLYAVSNAGSLVGLLSYPFLVEPLLGLHNQALTWGVLYAGFVAGCVWVAVGASRARVEQVRELYVPAADPAVPDTSPDWPRRGLWLALSAAGSVLLLATTNQVADQIAVIPFMWAVPLAIYLITFILAFSHRRLYWRPLYVLGGLALMYFVGRITYGGHAMGMGIVNSLMVYYLALFVCCMLCHGEVARLRPAPEYLTQYYLYVAVGGAMGGLFVALLAPHIFTGMWELYIGYFLCGLTVFISAMGDGRSLLNRTAARWGFRLAAGMTLVALGVGPYVLLGQASPAFCHGIVLPVARALGLPGRASADVRVLTARRNFYGIVRVEELFLAKSGRRQRALMHGQTLHGLQFIGDADARRIPTAYFSKHSGIGGAILGHPRYQNRNRSGMRVGILGLGVGTLAAYGREGDYYRMYEIDPEVVELATADGMYFTYLRDSKATIDIVPGDARISLEREEPQEFDVLAVDAFSGDSVPVHLLTKEAFELYARHTRPDGIIACNISNRYLDLRPIVAGLASAIGWQAYCVDTLPRGEESLHATWVLVLKDDSLLAGPVFASLPAERLFEMSRDVIRPWTDDYSNLFQVLRETPR